MISNIETTLIIVDEIKMIISSRKYILKNCSISHFFLCVCVCSCIPVLYIFHVFIPVYISTSMFHRCKLKDVSNIQQLGNTT